MQETRVQSLGQEYPWRRAWQVSPVFLPGKSHGQKSLMGYSPVGHKKSDMTEATSQAHPELLRKKRWYHGCCICGLWITRWWVTALQQGEDSWMMTTPTNFHLCCLTWGPSWGRHWKTLLSDVQQNDALSQCLQQFSLQGESLSEERGKKATNFDFGPCSSMLVWHSDSC